MTSSQTWLITGTVDDVAIGVFDSYSGGGAEAEVAKHRGGGMGSQKTYAAMPEYGDVTIGRDLDKERDVELHRHLMTRVGRGRASINVQPLDENGAPWGTPFTRVGRLSGLTDPESDSDSSDVTMFELTFVIESVA